MTTLAGIMFVLAGAVIMAAPVQIAAFLQRLGRGGPAEGYRHYDPQQVHRSIWLKTGYRFVGGIATVIGLALLDFLRLGSILAVRIWMSLAVEIGIAVCFIVAGYWFVRDPGWFERWQLAGKKSRDPYYGFRLRGYRVLGIVSILTGLWVVCDRLKNWEIHLNR